MLVLDTNVISELVRPDGSTAVAEALHRRRSDSLATTAVTEAELRFGLARLAEGQRRSLLTQVIDQVLSEALRGRVLPFDRAAAAAYGDLVAARSRIGQPISTFDAMIAGICVAAGAELATRNVRHFMGCGIELFNPWEPRR